MVSFRVSPEEYTQLRQACSVKGLRTLSELARTAMENLVLSSGQVIPLDLQVQELRDRVTALSDQIERLAALRQPDRTSAASNV